MVLETFLHNLHFDVDKLSPPDWEVDWEDAPLAYKLYRGLPIFPFSLEVPLTLEEWAVPSKPGFRRIGDFLWYAFGLTQFSQSIFPSDTPEQKEGFIQSFRRFAPSGGALYPNELYVYLKLDDLPAGIYHYDAAHHRLVLLREGNFDSYIAMALGNRCDMSACFGTVFVSTMFWKNFYKYNNFSYRLQGLDAGVLAGQLLEVAKRFGFESGVYFQFLDRAINHLLGLSEQEESVYTAILLSVEPTSWFTNVDIERSSTSGELCGELPEIQCSHYVRSTRVKEYPLLLAMNEASMLESTESFQHIHVPEEMKRQSGEISLPRTKPLSYDLALACRKRFSPEMDFVLGKVSLEQLSSLMREAADSFSYRNDLDRAYYKKDSHVLLYGCLYNIEDISNGAYLYDSMDHSLREMKLGDQRSQLQYGMSLDNVNMQQVPLCFHVAGDRNHLRKELGYRGYRIQQMEAGMFVQRLLLAASALGMGGHPLLGFNADRCDEIYGMKSEGRTSLIQIPMGPYRDRPWLKGSLLS